MGDWQTTIYEDRAANTDWIPHHAEVMVSPTWARQLQEILLEFASSRGAVTTETYLPPAPAGGFAMQVPRTRWHVRLGPPDKEELDSLVKLALLLFAGSGGDVKAISLALVNSVRERIEAARVEYGERSIAETVLRHQPATARAITDELAHRSCPFSDGACRFLDGERCGIDLAAVEQIIDGLVSRKILRRCNSFQPYEFAVVI